MSESTPNLRFCLSSSNIVGSAELGKCAEKIVSANYEGGAVKRRRVCRSGGVGMMSVERKGRVQKSEEWGLGGVCRMCFLQSV
ncbi:hypothetical protein PIB30_106305, partial [Stylosanthes scabra]|nr:hypothetical protein [Stylosanthes scabra]